MPNSVIKSLIKKSKKSEKEVEKIWSESKSIFMDDSGKKESEFKDKDWATITIIAKRKLGIKESLESSWITSFLESESNSKDFFENVDEQVISANLNVPEPIKEPYEDPDKEDEEEEVDEEVFSRSSFGGGSTKMPKHTCNVPDKETDEPKKKKKK